MQVILSAYESTIDLPSDDGDDGDGDIGLQWPVCNDESGTRRGGSQRGGSSRGGSQRGVSIFREALSPGGVAEKDAEVQQNRPPRNIAQVFPFPHPEHPRLGDTPMSSVDGPHKRVDRTEPMPSSLAFPNPGEQPHLGDTPIFIVDRPHPSLDRTELTPPSLPSAFPHPEHPPGASAV